MERGFKIVLLGTTQTRDACKWKRGEGQGCNVIKKQLVILGFEAGGEL